MTVGIRFAAIAEGQTFIRIRGCPLVGQWLMRYDPDAHGGLGEAAFTDDAEDALTFDGFEQARACWEQTSSVLPETLSAVTGEMVPNRPLMVVSIEVDTLS